MLRFDKKTFSQMILATTLVAAASNASALNILMVNDDGCNNPGLVTLANVLEQRGHTVTIYAPADEQSGQGSRLTLPEGSCTIRFEAGDTDLLGEQTIRNNHYCVTASVFPANDQCDSESKLPQPFIAFDQVVSASPADAAFIGLASFGDNPPDLVLSGINPGENVGAPSVFSGTVAATVASIRRGIPAIALSRSRLASGDFTPQAEFVADLLAELEQEADGDRLLPEKMGLNINFPAGTPAGVVFTRVGTNSTLDLEDNIQGDNSFVRGVVTDFVPRGLSAADIRDEADAQREGFISISTIDGDYNAKQAPRALTRLKLNNLQ